MARSLAMLLLLLLLLRGQGFMVPAAWGQGTSWDA
jgi:hypothetical protein